MPQKTFAQILIYLAGELLSSVEFVQDYLQLRFDGPTLNVSGSITVSAGNDSRTAWEAGFRDLLCGQIGKRVERITELTDDALTFWFADGSTITVSLVPDEGSPEALYFHDPSSGDWFAV